MLEQQNNRSTKPATPIYAALLALLVAFFFIVIAFLETPPFSSISTGSGEIMPAALYFFLSIAFSVLSAICWKCGTK